MFTTSTTAQFAHACRALRRNPRRAALDEGETLDASAKLNRTAAAVIRGELDRDSHPEVAGLDHLDAETLEEFARADDRERLALLRAFVRPPAPMVPPVPTTRPSTRPRERTSSASVARDDGSGDAAEPPSRVGEVRR